MTKKLDGRRHGDSSDALSTFAVRPSPRCSRSLGPSPHQVCGELARYLVRGHWWFEDRAYCGHCAPAGAIELPAEIAVRRVRLTLEVYIAGTHAGAPAAQQEALARVEAALVDSGAVVEVLAARSTFGRYPAPAALGEPIAVPDAQTAPPVRH